MLSGGKTSSFRCQKHRFCTLKAMLLQLKTYAFGKSTLLL